MRKKNIDFVYFFVIVAGLGIVGIGNYFILKNLSDVSNEVNNLKLTMEFSSQTQNIKVPTIISENPTKGRGLTTSSPSSSANDSQTQIITGESAEDIISIPTAVIFEAVSSPILQPQSNIPILIERVSKNKDGEVALHIKAFTSEASSYSAIEPRDLFELINLTGENQKPLKAIGVFDRMPPKSGVAGSVIFKIKPMEQTIILQINMGNEQKHYEFNFESKTYKETVIG